MQGKDFDTSEQAKSDTTTMNMLSSRSFLKRKIFTAAALVMLAAVVALVLSIPHASSNRPINHTNPVRTSLTTAQPAIANSSTDNQTNISTDVNSSTSSPSKVTTQVNVSSNSNGSQVQCHVTVNGQTSNCQGNQSYQVDGTTVNSQFSQTGSATNDSSTTSNIQIDDNSSNITTP